MDEHGWLRNVMLPGRFLAGFSLAAVLLSVGLVAWHGPDQLLLVMMGPILLAAYSARRWPYLIALLEITLLSVWVTHALSGSFRSSLATILTTSVVLLVASEMIHRIARAQERNETALRVSEDKLKTIFASAPVGIELYDRQGILENANQACLDILGVGDLAELLGLRLLDDPQIASVMQDSLQHEGTVRFATVLDFDQVRDLGLYRSSRLGTADLDILGYAAGRR